jgi:hypothetical protein
MARSTLGSTIHLLSVLLIHEHNGHIVAKGEKVRVGKFQGLAGLGAKNKAAHGDAFGFPRGWRLGVLAGPHGIEVGTEHKVGGVGVGGGTATVGVVSEELEELLQELGGDGFLSVGWRISVDVRF